LDNQIEDINKLSLSLATNDKLQTLMEDGYFNEKLDAYRIGISLSLIKDSKPPEISPPKAPGLYSLSQIDPDRALENAIQLLLGTNDTPYRWAERLAEAGICELYDIAQKYGDIDFLDLIKTHENS
jgi:hypothetical protein